MACRLARQQSPLVQPCAGGLFCCLVLFESSFLAGGFLALLAAAGRVSPRRATYLFVARQKARGKNVPYIQRPRKLREANLSGQPAATTITGVRHNSLRAKAFRSDRCRKSEHEVWLSCGSQTAGVCCDRRRWLKGWGRDTACESWLANHGACAFLAVGCLHLLPLAGEGGDEGGAASI